MIQRVAVIVLLVAVAGIGGLVTATVPTPAGRPSQPRHAGTTAARWIDLSEAQRAAYVRSYEALMARNDTATVLARVETFAALPAAKQARLRRLHTVLHEVLSKLPASRLQSLLALDERARAEAVIDLLETESPGLFQTLCDEAQGHS